MIHLIVGNTGSGKTTYSNKLKQETGGLIFSIDQWNKTLFFPDKNEGDGLEWFLERIERSEGLMMDLVKQLQASGVDAILDLGLSKTAHREKFRVFAATNGFDLKTHFLDISRETRLKRIWQRNKEQGATFEFEVTDENFEFMEAWFERPEEGEMKNGIIITE